MTASDPTNIRAAVLEDVSKRTITVNVVNAPDITASDPDLPRPRIMRPERVVLEMTDGRQTRITVTGPLVLMNGGTSMTAMDWHSWSLVDSGVRQRHIDKAPTWVRAIWDDAPRGERYWDLGQEGTA